MRYPQFLPEHGTIGFVAPSYGCNMEPYKTAFGNAQKKLKGLGYSLDLGPNCYEGSGIGISSTPENCGRELMEYYCSAKNDVLISCGGGELMCEDLDYVDFDALEAAEPKWYLGYSDNTNMTFLLPTLCDTAAVYGPCAGSFGMEPWHPCITDALNVLTGKCLIVHNYKKYEMEGLKDEDHPLAPYNCTEPFQLTKIPDQKTEMQGRLIGGCLDVLSLYTGTPFDRVKEFCEKYREDGIIWFLEACDLNTMGMRRALWQLEHAGWFRYVKGFLIGRPYHHGESAYGLDQYDAVSGILKKYHVPIIMDCDFGHIPPAMPLISGCLAKVTSNRNDLTVEMMLK